MSRRRGGRLDGSRDGLKRCVKLVGGLEYICSLLESDAVHISEVELDRDQGVQLLSIAAMLSLRQSKPPCSSACHKSQSPRVGRKGSWNDISVMEL